MSVISLSTDGNKVGTDDQDSVVLTVFAIDSSNAALEGATINLSTDAGLLLNNQVVTDASGTATVSFRAGPEQANQFATITAFSGTVDPAEIPIAILGTTLNLVSDKTSVLSGGMDTISLTGEARAVGDAIFGSPLTLSSSAGNTLEGIDGNGDSVSGTQITLTTDVNGEVKATFTGDVTGTDTLTLSGLGSEDTLEITVTDAQFGFTDPAEGTVVTVGNSVDLTVTWIDSAGLPVTGETLTFTPNIGSLSSSSAITDAAGEATVTYTASTIAAPATIQVKSGALEDSITLDIRSITPDRVDLQATPSVIPISFGTVTSTSTISAIVRDSANNAVAGVTVQFELTEAPGGGEFLFPVSALTNSAGLATTTFTSGGSVSAQNGVHLKATVEGFPAVTSEATLTIGQQPADLDFGTTNKITTVTSNGLEVGYALPITLLVTDTNSNPIIDQTINLGLYPLRFRTGFWDDPTNNASSITVTGTFDNEDANRNGILDPGEDGSTGFPVNGSLDPGSVAQIPVEVTTDENGLAAFEVVYPKSSAIWVDVELQATTFVSGSEASAAAEETLQRLNSDLPLINSPFN